VGSPPVRSAKAAKLLGVPPSRPQPPQEQGPILNRQGYDLWVQNCYIPWLSSESKPESGQTRLEFFREGAGIQVGKDYEEWLNKDGLHLAEVAGSNDWRESFHRFLMTKTSEAVHALIDDSDDSIIIVQHRRNSRGDFTQGGPIDLSSDAAETEEAQGASNATRFQLWLTTPAALTLRKVLEKTHNEEEIEAILREYAQELLGQEEDESKNSLEMAIARSASHVRQLKDQTRRQKEENQDLKKRLSQQAKPSRTSVDEVDDRSTE